MERIGNKMALVTGSTDGIGKQTALGLASGGYDVIVTGRNSDKGEHMCNELKRLNPNGNFKYYAVDFSSQQSIIELSNTLNREVPHLNVLVNNVGLFTSERKLSVDGYELMLAVNYLSAFLLSYLLLEKLKKSGSARIVNVTGGAYKFGKIHFKDLSHKERFSSFKALGQAKLANVLFAYEAERRWSGYGIHSFVVDPGAASTPGHKEHSFFLLKWLLPFIGTSVEAAAHSSLEAATSSIFNGVGGIFLNKKGKPELSSPLSRDEAMAKQLWNISHDMLKIDSLIPKK